MSAAPSPVWRATLAVMRLLPQGLLSRAAGALADLPIPGFLRRPVLGGFARSVGIDLSEASRPLESYGSVNDLFVRRLREGVRSFPPGADRIASPVDGVVGQFGRIEAGRAVQAKGRDYAVADLIGDPDRVAPLEGGTFLTIYLSPRHYHRIHTPLPGTVVEARHVPGRLFPVNLPAVASVDQLFVVNERLVVHLDAEPGPVSVVAVGAYNVGRISAAFDPAWSGEAGTSVTNRGTPPPAHRRYTPGIDVARGEEIMAFHLGSTVVLLIPPTLHPAEHLASGLEVKVGQVLAVPAAEPHTSQSTLHPPPDPP